MADVQRVEAGPVSEEYVLLWPDGFWCFEEDLAMCLAWKSDDYQKVPARQVEGATDIDDDDAAVSI